MGYVTKFLSTPSARRATYKRTELEPSMDISIHALREEGDSRRKRSKSNLKYFYPRPPRGGRPRRATDAKHRGSDFYPRPPRGGRLRKPLSWCAIWRFLSTPSARRATSRQLWMALPSMISIHALREEGDFGPFSGKMFSLISIHALREEGDMMFALWMPMSCYFYPRPPRGGRLDPHRFTAVSLDISIHALREEGDLLAEIVKLVELISIHALREEGDTGTPATATPATDFYPRPPRGGRPSQSDSMVSFSSIFLSTPSARRATAGGGYLLHVHGISIHALREEGDRKMRKARRRSSISIHALREEGDPMMMTSRSEKGISIHALREEGDPAPRLHRSA